MRYYFVLLFYLIPSIVSDEDLSHAMVRTPTEYAMGGCKVKFPAKAYPSQVAMMSRMEIMVRKIKDSFKVNEERGHGNTT